jgi:hypothetical protein
VNIKIPQLLFIFFFLTACSAELDSPEWATPVTDGTDGVDYLLETKTAQAQATQVAQLTASAPTVDARLLAEEWQTWPIVPEISYRTREIYRKGLARGNDPHAFSKVGDCQNLKEYFLGKFDHLDMYHFNWNIDPYMETIDQFQGNFYRDGQSTQFGYTAASPITQLMAGPDMCLPEETPLECEIRINKPTFLLISLEFPFSDRSPGLYEQYIRQIVEYSMSQGVVPILATKADNVEGDHSINLVIAKLAYEYDIPMWNWWAAAQPLGDHGIDILRDEGLGFHITEQAWEERSKTFLKVLDYLWKNLRDIG